MILRFNPFKLSWIKGDLTELMLKNTLRKTTGICAYFFGKYARISGDKIIIHGPNGEKVL